MYVFFPHLKKFTLVETMKHFVYPPSGSRSQWFLLCHVFCQNVYKKQYSVIFGRNTPVLMTEIFLFLSGFPAHYTLSCELTTTRRILPPPPVPLPPRWSASLSSSKTSASAYLSGCTRTLHVRSTRRPSAFQEADFRVFDFPHDLSCSRHCERIYLFVLSRASFDVRS